MKRLFPLTLLAFCVANAFAQNLSGRNSAYNPSHLTKINKPIIDSIAINNWTSLGSGNDPAISNDGKYIAYTVGNTFLNRLDSLIVQATDNSWRQAFPGGSNGFFSSDNKQYIVEINGDLCFLPLGMDTARYVKGISSYKVAKSEWMAWQINGNDEELVLHNVKSGKEERFSSVKDYSFSQMGNLLVLKISVESGIVLKALRLSDGQSYDIWSSEDKNKSLIGYSLDAAGERLVFLLHDSSQRDSINQGINSVWYYKIGMYKAEMLVNDNSPGMKYGFFIQGIPSFIANGDYVSFTLGKLLEKSKAKENEVKLDVWNHKDRLIQSFQLKPGYVIERYRPSIYYASTKVDKSSSITSSGPRKVIYITADDEIQKSIIWHNSRFAVIGKNINGDRFWEKNFKRDSNFLVSLKDGSRILLKSKQRESNFWFSPDGKYLVYFDVDQKSNYFSYNLETGILLNISAKVPDYYLGDEEEFNRPKSPPSLKVGIAGWLESKDALLVYDNYDVWQLDLAGKKPPINITNGSGRKHKIEFRLTFGIGITISDAIFTDSSSLLLTAFNKVNKYNGFYQKTINKKGDPELLTMGPYVFDLPSKDASYFSGDGMKPIKSRDANIWIVQRQTATEAPNYFLTIDFKNYKAITNLQPQKDWNWLTSELISFEQLDMTTSKGILYKPENFDSTLKYPVLISYYEQMSSKLYRFPTPAFARGATPNIPWFVSRGYLVFTPDIYFTRGQTGQSALNTIEGAARHLSKLPFVDSKRMGISGHSYGGGHTNYIVTHSKMFAAAVAGVAPASNWVSAALQLATGSGWGEFSRLEILERENGGINIWQNPGLWTKEAPIMNAHRVTSPFLIFCCKKDKGWPQAIEMFIALRRLEKKTWMLQYDNGGHTVSGDDAKDFTIRYTQFFDHYLKAAPAPRWMTQGIPAKLKGIEYGYEADVEGSCGNNCKVCKLIKEGKFNLSNQSPILRPNK